MALAERFARPGKPAPATALKITCPDYRPLPDSRRCMHYLPGGGCGLPGGFMCTEWLKLNQHQLYPAPPSIEAKTAQGAPSDTPKTTLSPSRNANTAAKAPGIDSKALKQETLLASGADQERALKAKPEAFGEVEVSSVGPAGSSTLAAPVEAKTAQAAHSDTTKTTRGPGKNANTPAKGPSIDSKALKQETLLTGRGDRERSLEAKPRAPSEAEISSFVALNAQVLLRTPAGEEFWLVPQRSGRTDRTEISARDAASILTICAAFPSAKVTGIERKEGIHGPKKDGASKKDLPACPKPIQESLYFL